MGRARTVTARREGIVSHFDDTSPTAGGGTDGRAPDSHPAAAKRIRFAGQRQRPIGPSAGSDERRPRAGQGRLDGQVPTVGGTSQRVENQFECQSGFIRRTLPALPRAPIVIRQIPFAQNR